MNIYSPPKSEVVDLHHQEIIPALWVRSLLSILTIFFAGIAPNISLWAEFKKIGVPFETYLNINLYQLIFSAVFIAIIPFAWSGRKTAVFLLLIATLLFTISALFIPSLIINHMEYQQIIVLSIWPIIFYKHKIKEVLNK